MVGIELADTLPNINCYAGGYVIMICVAAGTISSPSWVTVPTLRCVFCCHNVIIPSPGYSKGTSGIFSPTSISIQQGGAISTYNVPSPHQMPVTSRLPDSYAIRCQIYAETHGEILLCAFPYSVITPATQ